jgi:rod shape-determining protein MreD
LTVPFAALVALIAALLETTVLSELPIAGATANLVLVTAVSATLILGTQDGMAAAFLGGLLIDLLVPDRPLGAATLSLLVIAGLAILAARFAGPGRRWMAVALTVVLTPPFHAMLAVILSLTENAPLLAQPIGTLAVTILVAAFMNGVLAFPVAAMFAAIERRFGPAEHVDW